VFDKAMFSGDARFDGATFSGAAGFDEATFFGDAMFGGARSPGGANRLQGVIVRFSLRRAAEARRWAAQHSASYNGNEVTYASLLVPFIS
jgi:Pentapeptide repeats (9 copies)